MLQPFRSPPPRSTSHASDSEWNLLSNLIFFFFFSFEILEARIKKFFSSKSRRGEIFRACSYVTKSKGRFLITRTKNSKIGNAFITHSFSFSTFYISRAQLSSRAPFFSPLRLTEPVKNIVGEKIVFFFPLSFECSFRERNYVWGESVLFVGEIIRFCKYVCRGNDNTEGAGW